MSDSEGRARLKILLLGAGGTIGSTLGALLEARHEVIKVGHGHEEVTVDMATPESLQKLFAEIGPVDAVISAPNVVRLSKIEELLKEDFAASLNNRLLGQMNLVRYGRTYLREGGSFTLTSAILPDYDHPANTILSAVNASLHRFVSSAALKLPPGQRVNAVCPPMLRETVERFGLGTGGTPVAQVIPLYVHALEGDETGQVITMGSIGH